MKSIRFFIETLHGGGAEHILELLVASLDKSKYKVQVVSQEQCPFSSVKHKYFFKRNTNNSKLREFINKIIVKFSLVAPESLVKSVFMRGKFDIEVAFCEGNATRLIGNSSAKPGCKKVAWIHTDVLNNPWSEAVFGSAEEERRCYEKFDRIVCVSETMRDSFIKKYGMAEKVSVLYNVIDYDLIKSKSHEESDFTPSADKINFIMVGRLVAVKGYERIVKAAEKLKHDGYKFTFSILGKGEDESKLAAAIKAAGLENEVKLLGYSFNPYSYIAKTDALVCSSYAEGYSTVVTEAIALGKPVITTECSGMREIFGGRECGIICENNDDSLYFALKNVLDNPGLLTGYAEEAQRRAEEFSKEVCIKAVEKFFDEA